MILNLSIALYLIRIPFVGGKFFFTEIKWLRTSKAWPKYQMLDPRLGLWCSKKYKVSSCCRKVSNCCSGLVLQERGSIRGQKPMEKSPDRNIFVPHDRCGWRLATEFEAK